MSAVAAPADRRFHRAHVKPARRRTWRRFVRPGAKYVLVAIAAAYGLYRGSVGLAHARLMQVDHIVVHGNARLSTGEVLALMSGLRGESLLKTDLNQWREQLLASPWVRDAAIRRVLPSTVEVAIVEREPIGMGRMNGSLYLIDDRGSVIDEYGPQYADLDLAIVDGLFARTGGRPTGTDEVRADLTSRVTTALKANPTLARRVSQIDVSDAHNAAVVLSGDPAVIYLGDDRFLPRLESYLELRTALRDRVPDIDYVDVRFDDRVYVRPAGSGGQRAAVSIKK